MPTLLRVRPWDRAPATSWRGVNYRPERESHAHLQVGVALRPPKAPPTEAGPISVLEFDQSDWLWSSLEAQVAQW